MEAKHRDQDKGYDIDTSKCGGSKDGDSSDFKSPGMGSPSKSIDADSGDVLENFITFTSSNDFINTIQDFYLDNCAGFECYTELLESGCGLKLEWMDTYKRFMDIVDDQLTKFCEIYSHLSVKQVFDRLQESIDEMGDAAYVPLLIKSLDEQYFFNQMCSHARRSLNSSSVGPSIVADSKVDSNVDNIVTRDSPFEGMWFADKNSFNADFDNWLKKLSVPWAFRKVISLAYSSSSGGAEFHINREKETLTLTSIIPIVGAHMAFFHFDKEWRRETDPRGEAYTTYCDFINETRVLTKIKRKKFSGPRADYLVISEYFYEADAGPNRAPRITNTRSLFLDCDEGHNPDATLCVHLYR